VVLGGVVIATGRAKADGTFSIPLFIPISGEGASPMSVMDTSGNVATTSFYTEFGFDSFQNAVSGLQTKVNEIAALVQKTPTPAPAAPPVAVTPTQASPTPAPATAAPTPAAPASEESGGSSTWLLVVALAVAALALLVAVLALSRGKAR